jgi:hypothetical protein
MELYTSTSAVEEWTQATSHFTLLFVNLTCLFWEIKVKGKAFQMRHVGGVQYNCTHF